MIFSRGSSSRRDCATTDRGSADDGVRWIAVGLHPEGSDLPIRAAMPVLLRNAVRRLATPRRAGLPPFLRAGEAVGRPGDAPFYADARIAITGVASRPLAIDARALVGTKLEDDAIAAAADVVHKGSRPMDNTSGTISQRKRASRVFTERALRSLRDA